MFDDEGAVNGWADASPADSEGEFLPEFDRDDGAGADVGNSSYYSTEPETVEEADPEIRGREGFIPRDRYDQVHGRAQQLEQELLWQRERNELAQRAMAAGYRDVEQFEHDDSWARSNHYDGIEQYLEMRQTSPGTHPASFLGTPPETGGGGEVGSASTHEKDMPTQSCRHGTRYGGRHRQIHPLAQPLRDVAEDVLIGHAGGGPVAEVLLQIADGFVPVRCPVQGRDLLDVGGE